MNNITMADINQNRVMPGPKCFECGKEFEFGEERICTGGAGWTAFEYHPKCLKKREDRMVKSSNVAISYEGESELSKQPKESK